MKKRSWLKLATTLAVVGVLAACGGSKKASDAKEIYIFNGKSEIGESFKTLASDYEKETGVKVKIFSPGSGADTKETFNTEMTSKNAPTIFSNPTLLTWGPREGDYMFDINQSDNAKLKELAAKVPENLRLSVDGQNLGLPYTLEGYGYAVNKKVLADVFATQDVDTLLDDIKKATYEEFNGLVKAADAYIQKNESTTIKLNGKEYTTAKEKTEQTKALTGVFVIAGAEKWTYGNHMVNFPINTIFNSPSEALYAPAKDFAQAKDALKKYIEVVEFNTNYTAGENAPLKRSPEYINSTVGSYDNALRLFGEKKGLFIKQGNWIYPSLVKLNVKDLDSLTLLPVKMPFTQEQIKTGFTPAEFNATIPTFVPNYFILNKRVSKEKRQLSEDFLVWLYTSERGLKFMKEEAGFIMYNDLDTSKTPNPLNKAIGEYLKAGKTLSNPFDASPGDFLDFTGNTIKEDYLTKETWDTTTYDAFADKLIKKWEELKQDAK